MLATSDWLKSLSPIRISPHDDEESDDESDEAAEDDAEVTPDALEQNNAVEANEDRGELVVNDDDRLAAWWLLSPDTSGIGTPCI